MKTLKERTSTTVKNEADLNKFHYLLHLADNALLLSHRNSEWCGHGPVLEQDIAITNIALDLIGQARNFFQYAASFASDRVTEDALAFLRNEHEYKNCLLVEQPDEDWAMTILRQFFFSVYQFLLYEKLQNSNDEQIAAIAAKALKEVAYHLRWSSEWVIRLGDGTEESHQRMLNAIDELWTFTGEMFIPDGYETQAYLDGFGVDPSSLKLEWIMKVHAVFNEATLPLPPENVWMQQGGKQGRHTENLGYILSELQYMQRTYPGCDW